MTSDRIGDESGDHAADGIAATSDDGAPSGNLPVRLPPLPTGRSMSGRPLPAPLDGTTGFRGYLTERVQPEDPDRATEARDTGRSLAAQRALDLASPAARAAIGPMPGGTAKLSRKRELWFYVALVAPIVIGALYLFLIAPNQYVTEYRFSVREPVAQQAAASAGTGAMAALFGGNPTPGSDLLDNYTITDYVRSPQAARDLDARLNLRQMFGKPADPFARLNAGAPDERLARYWQNMVYSDYDPASGLAVVRVHAFTPQDSFAIATTLVGLSDTLVNSIGRKSQQDSLEFARAEVGRANEQVAELRREMAGVRQVGGVIDPTTGVVSTNDTLSTTLRTSLAQLATQITALTQQLKNPNAPQLVFLRQQFEATRVQIAKIDSEVTRTTGSHSSLANTVGRFEDVNTRLQNASQVLLTSVANLSQAQSNADSQRLYLTTYMKPAMPQSSTFPNRWVSLLIVSLLACMVWMIGMLIGNSVLEHGW